MTATLDRELMFHPSVTRHPFGYIATLSSEQMDALADEVANDLVRLSSKHNALVQMGKARRESSGRDMHHLFRRVEELQARLDNADFVQATRGVRLKLSREMHNAGPISYLSASPQNLKVQVATTYGQATIPINAIQSRFYGTNLVTGAIVPSEGLSIAVTGVFDKGLGDGLTDYEGATDRLLLDEGDPALAFNGVNIDTWIRRLEFPLDSDISEIETELTVRVPPGTNAEGNVITIFPHPLGNVDVTGVYTAPDLGDTFTVIPGFSTTNNALPDRWFFPAQPVQQVRVRLRQRDWVEENGRKVFYIGAQELGLYLVDWDKTWNVSGTPDTNHSMLTAFEAPDGFAFKTLHLLRTDPMFTLESSGSRHLHLQVSLDDTLSDVRWNSDTDALPQSTANGITLGGTATTVYVLTVMNWVATTGGVDSPFEVGAPPWLKDIGLECTFVAV